MVHCINHGVRIYNFQVKIVFLSLKIIVISANSLDPDEISHFAPFHMGLHCSPKNLFLSHQFCFVNHFSVMYGRFPVFLGSISTKQRIKFLVCLI